MCNRCLQRPDTHELVIQKGAVADDQHPEFVHELEISDSVKGAVADDQHPLTQFAGPVAAPAEVLPGGTGGQCPRSLLVSPFSLAASGTFSVIAQQADSTDDNGSDGSNLEKHSVDANGSENQFQNESDAVPDSFAKAFRKW